VRLSHRDFDLLQRTILELYAHRDAPAFRQIVPSLFAELAPGSHFALYDLDVNPAAHRMRIADFWESTTFSTEDVVSRLERAAFFGHPFTEYSIRTHDPSALKFSDFYTLRQFRNTALYSEAYSYISLERHLAVMSFTGPLGISTISFSRFGRAPDFTERDRLLLNLLRPHFDQARRNAELATERRAAQAKPVEAYGLTPREREVAHWLSQGKTNPEIAAILDARLRTVHKHVENILGKLGVENRTTAAVMISQSNGQTGGGQPPRVG
jgi:DNA-binding CsgD family transcriptional regulator